MFIKDETELYNYIKHSVDFQDALAIEFEENYKYIKNNNLLPFFKLPENHLIKLTKLYPEKFERLWEYIGENSSIPICFIEANASIRDWGHDTMKYLNRNRNMTPACINKVYPNLGYSNKVCWRDWEYNLGYINLIHPITNELSIVRYLGVTFNRKIVNTNFDWHWGVLSRDAPLDFIEDNLDLPWDFKYLSSNKSLTWKFVKKFQDREWDWGSLARNWFGYDTKVFDYWTAFVMSIEKSKIIHQTVNSWIWKPVCNDNLKGTQVSPYTLPKFPYNSVLKKGFHSIN